MTPPGTATALSDVVEVDRVLSDEAASELEDEPEQVEAEGEAETEPFEAETETAAGPASVLSAAAGEEVQEQISPEAVQSSGNQRPSTIAISEVMPVHTSQAQTSVSQRSGRRRRRKNQDPAFCYQVMAAVAALVVFV